MMPSTDRILLERRYLFNLLYKEGCGRQTLVMRTLKYLLDVQLVSEAELASVEHLFDRLLPAGERDVAAPPGRRAFLLAPHELEELRDALILVLLRSLDGADYPPATTVGADEEKADLDELDRGIYRLVCHRSRYPDFREYIDSLVPFDLALYATCAAMLDSMSGEIFGRLQPQASLCRGGWLEHLGEAGYCLDDVCRIINKEDAADAP